MDAREQIQAAWQGFTAAWQANDPTGAASWYTAEAVNLPPGQAEMRGREQIEHQYQGFFRAFRIEDFSHRTVELEVYGKAAYELGSFGQCMRPRAGGELIAEQARYMAIWKQEGDGTWRLHRFLWAPLPPDQA